MQLVAHRMFNVSIVLVIMLKFNDVFLVVPFAVQPVAHRMFFLSIPPNVFVQAAGGAADNCSSS